MQYAGLPTVHGTSGATHPMQYGHGEVAGQAQQQPQPNASTTSILRNYRKKDSGGNPAEKVQGPEAGSSTGEPQGPVARVAPHAHYPKPNGDGFRYQHFPDFGIQAPQVAPPPVKYSEIIEPPMPTLEHHLPPHAIPKAKDKPSYFDISCSQPHVKGYDFNFGMRPVNNLYKQQYGPPTNAPGPLHHGYYPTNEKPLPPHQQPPGYVVNYNKMHQYQARYGQGPRDAGNDFLSNLNKIAPEIAQDILNDPHLRDHQQFPVYLPDQNRLYQQQHARMYQRGTPPGGFNQRNFNYNQYQLNQRENYPRFYQNRFQQFDNNPFPNFNHCAQLNYPPQPYQHFRQQDLLPLHPKNFLESHPEIPEIVPEEAGPPSKSLKSYLENWNEENFLDDTDNPIDASEAGPRSKENTLYVLEAMEIPSESVPQYIHLQPIEKLPPNVQRFYPEKDRDPTEPNPACKLLQDIAIKHRADQPSHPVLHIPDDVPSKSLPILIQDDDEENSNRGNIRWSDCEQENKIRNENPDFSEIGFTSREDSTKKTMRDNQTYFTEMKQDVGSKENDSDLSEINNDKNFDKSNQNRNDTQNNVLKRVGTQNIADIKDYVSRENENTNKKEETLKNIKGENSDKLKESNFHKSKSIRDFTDIGNNIRGYVSGENTDEETLKNIKDKNSDDLKESNFHKSKSINKNFTDIGDGIKGYVIGENTEEETLKNIKSSVNLKDENSDSNKYDKHNLFQTDFRENVNEDSLKATKSSDLKSERFDKFKKSKSIGDFTDIGDDIKGYVSGENTDEETLKNIKDGNSDKLKESNLHKSKSINKNFADIGGYVWGENTDEEMLKNTTRSGLKDENSDKFKESDFHKTEMMNRNLSDSSKYDEHNLIQTDLRENANDDTLKSTKGSNLKTEKFDYNKSRSINKNTEMINRNLSDSSKYDKHNLIQTDLRENANDDTLKNTKGSNLKSERFDYNKSRSINKNTEMINRNLSDSNKYDEPNLIQTDFRDDLRENVNEDSLNTTKGSDLKSERFDKFKGSDYNKSKSIKKKFTDIGNNIRGYVSGKNPDEETLNTKGSDLKGENFDKFKESDYNKSKSTNKKFTDIGNDIRGYVSGENPDEKTLKNIKSSDLKGENFDKFKESDYNKSKSINTNFVDIGDDIRGYISGENTDEETLKNMNRSDLKDENSIKFKEADFHRTEMINRNLSDSNNYNKHNLIQTNLRENVNEDPLKITKGSDSKSGRFDKVKESDCNKSKSINTNFMDTGDDIRDYVLRENTDKETIKNVKGSVSLKDENFDKFKESDYNKSKLINKNFTDIGDDIRGYVSRETTDKETLENTKDENFDRFKESNFHKSKSISDNFTDIGNNIRGYVSRENTDKETLKDIKGSVSLKDENFDKSKVIKMTNRNDSNKYEEHNLIHTDLRENANEDTLKNMKGSDLKSEIFDYNKSRSINKNLSDIGNNIRGYVLGQAVDKLKNMKPSSKSINKNQSDIGNDFRGYDSRENLNELTNSYKSNDILGYVQWETEDEKTLNRSKSINQNLSIGRNDVIRYISKEEVKESNSHKSINQNLSKTHNFKAEDPPQSLENQVFSETTKANQNRGKPQSPKVAKKLFKQFRITDPIRKYQVMSSSKTDDNQNNSTDDLDVSPIDLSTKFEAEAAESSSDSEIETTDYETECTSSSSSEDTGSRGDQEDDVYESCLLSTENRLLIRKTVSSAKKTALNKETKQKTKNDILDKSSNITNETRKPHLSSMENLEAFDKVSRKNTKKRDKESTHLIESTNQPIEGNLQFSKIESVKEPIRNKRFKNDSRIKMRINRNSAKESECYDSELEILQTAPEGDSKRKHIEDEILKDREEEEDEKTRCYLPLGNVQKSSKRFNLKSSKRKLISDFGENSEESFLKYTKSKVTTQEAKPNLFQNETQTLSEEDQFYEFSKSDLETVTKENKLEIETKDILTMGTIQKIPESNIRKNKVETICSFEEEETKTKGDLSKGTVQKDSEIFNIKSSKLFKDEKEEETQFSSGFNLKTPKRKLILNSDFEENCEGSSHNLQSSKSEMTIDENHLLKTKENLFQITSNSSIENNDEVKTKGYCLMGTVQKDSERCNFKSSKRELILDSKDAMVIEEMNEFCRGELTTQEKIEISDDESSKVNLSKNEEESNHNLENSKGFNFKSSKRKLSWVDNFEEDCEESSHNSLKYTKIKATIQKTNFNQEEEKESTKKKCNFEESNPSFESSENKSVMLKININESSKSKTILETDYNLFEDEIETKENLAKGTIQINSESNITKNCEGASHNLESSKSKMIPTTKYNLFKDEIKAKKNLIKDKESIHSIQSSKSKTIGENNCEPFEDEIKTKESLIKGNIQITSKGSIGNKEESNHSLESSKSTIQDFYLFKDEIKTKESFIKENVQITSKSSIGNNEESIHSIQSSKSKTRPEMDHNLLEDEIKTKENFIKENKESNHSLEPSKSTIQETNLKLFEDETKIKESLIKKNVQITSKSSTGNNKELIHSIQSSKSRTIPEMDHNLFKEELKTEESHMKGYVQITSETNIRKNPEESICSNEPNLNLFKDEMKTKESLIKKNVQITSESSIGNNKESNHNLESSKSTIQETNRNLFEDEIKAKTLIKKNVQITSKSSIGNNEESNHNLESSKSTIQEPNLNLFEDEIQTKESLIKENIQITSKSSIGNTKESNHSLESSKSTIQETNLNLFEDEIQTKQSLIKENIQITSKSSIGNNKESNYNIEPSKSTIQETNLNLFEDEIQTKQSLIKENIQITSKSSIGNNKESNHSLKSSNSATQETNLNLFEDEIQTRESLIKGNIQITSKGSIGNNKELNRSLESSKSTIQETNLNLFEDEIQTKQSLKKENIQITCKSSIGNIKESNHNLESSKSTIQETNLNLFEDEIKSNESLIKKNIQTTSESLIENNEKSNHVIGSSGNKMKEESNCKLLEDVIKTKESLIKGNIWITSKSSIGSNEESNRNLEVSKHKTIEETNRKLSKDEVKTKENMIRETTNLKLFEEVDFPRINEEKEEMKTKDYPSIGNFQKYSEGFKPFKRKFISDNEETNLSEAEIKPNEQLSHSFKSIKSMSTIEETNIEDEQNEEAKHNLETSKSNKMQKANLNLFKDEIKTKELQVKVPKVTSTEGNNEESSCKANTNKFSESELTIQVDKLETKAKKNTPISNTKNKLTSRKNKKRDIQTKEYLLKGSIQNEKESICTLQDENLQMGNVQITTDSNIQKSEKENEIELMEDEVTGNVQIISEVIIATNDDKSIRNFTQKTEQDSEKNIQTLEKTRKEKTKFMDREENEFSKFDSQESEKQTNEREHPLGTVQKINSLANIPKTKDNLIGEEDEMNVQKTNKTFEIYELDRDGVETKPCLMGGVLKIPERNVEENKEESKSTEIQMSKTVVIENVTGIVPKIQTQEGVTMGNETELVANLGFAKLKWNDDETNEGLMENVQKIDEEKIQTNDLMRNVLKTQTESLKSENIQQIGFTKKLEKSGIEAKDNLIGNIQKTFENELTHDYKEGDNIKTKDHPMGNVQKNQTNKSLKSENIRQIGFTKKQEESEIETKDRLVGNIQKIQTNESLRLEKIQQTELLTNKLETQDDLFSKDNLKTKDCYVGYVQKIHEQKTQTDENEVETKYNIMAISSGNLQFSEERDNLKTKDCLMGNVQKIQTNESLTSENIQQIESEESEIKPKDNLISNVQKIQANENPKSQNIRHLTFANKLEESEIKTKDNLMGNIQQIGFTSKLEESETEIKDRNMENIQQIRFTNKSEENEIELKDHLIKNVQKSLKNEDLQCYKGNDHLMGNVQKIQANESLKSENIQQTRFTNKLEESEIEPKDLIENIQKSSENELIHDLPYYKGDNLKTKDHLMGNVQKIRTNENLRNFQQIGLNNKLEESDVDTKDMESASNLKPSKGNLKTKDCCVGNVQKIHEQKTQTDEDLTSGDIQQTEFTDKQKENGSHNLQFSKERDNLKTKVCLVGNIQKIQTNESFKSQNIREIRFTNKLEESEIEPKDNLIENVQKTFNNELITHDLQYYKGDDVKTKDRYMRNVQKIQTSEGLRKHQQSENIRQIRFTNKLEESGIETKDSLVGNIQEIQINECLNSKNIPQIRFTNELEEIEIETQDNLVGYDQKIQTNEGLNSENIRQIGFTKKLEENKIETQDNLMGNVQKIQTNEGLNPENIKQIRFTNKLEENRIETNDNLMGNIQEIQINEGFNSKNIPQIRFTNELKEIEIETQDNLVGNVQKIQTNESLESENIRQMRFSNKLEENKTETRDNFMGNVQKIQANEGLNSENIRQIGFTNKLGESEIEPKDNLIENVQKTFKNELTTHDMQCYKGDDVKTKDHYVRNVQKIQTSEGLKSENIRQIRFSNKLEENKIETQDNLMGSVQKIQINESLKSENIQQIGFTNKLEENKMETKDNFVGNIQELQTNEGLNSENIRHIRFTNKLEESEIETKDNLMGNIQKIQTNESFKIEKIQQIGFTNKVAKSGIETKDNLVGNVQKIQTNEGLMSENIQQIGFTNKLEEIEIETKDNLIGNVQKIKTNEGLKSENIQQIGFNNKLEENKMETKDNFVGNIQEIQTNESLNSKNIRQIRFSNKLEENKIGTSDNLMGNIQEIQTNEDLNPKNIRQNRFSSKLEENKTETKDNLVGNVQKIQTNESFKSENIQQVGFTNEQETKDNLIGTVQKIQTNESLKSKNIRHIRFTNKLDESELETEDNLMGNVQKIQTNEGFKSENIQQIGFTNELEESEIETEDNLIGNVHKIQTNESLKCKNIRHIRFTNKLEESEIETRDNLIGNVQKFQTNESPKSNNIRHIRVTNKIETGDNLMMGNVQKIQTNETPKPENIPQIGFTDELEESRIETEDYLMENIQKELASNVEFSKTDDGNLKTKDCYVGNIQKIHKRKTPTNEIQQTEFISTLDSNETSNHNLQFSKGDSVKTKDHLMGNETKDNLIKNFEKTFKKQLASNLEFPKEADDLKTKDFMGNVQRFHTNESCTTLENVQQIRSTNKLEESEIKTKDNLIEYVQKIHKEKTKTNESLTIGNLQNIIKNMFSNKLKGSGVETRNIRDTDETKTNVQKTSEGEPIESEGSSKVENTKHEPTNESEDVDHTTEKMKNKELEDEEEAVNETVDDETVENVILEIFREYIRIDVTESDRGKKVISITPLTDVVVVVNEKTCETENEELGESRVNLEEVHECGGVEDLEKETAAEELEFDGKEEETNARVSKKSIEENSSVEVYEVIDLDEVDQQISMEEKKIQIETKNQTSCLGDTDRSWTHLDKVIKEISAVEVPMKNFRQKIQESQVGGIQKHSILKKSKLDNVKKAQSFEGFTQNSFRSKKQNRVRFDEVCQNNKELNTEKNFESNQVPSDAKNTESSKETKKSSKAQANIKKAQSSGRVGKIKGILMETRGLQTRLQNQHMKIDKTKETERFDKKTEGILKVKRRRKYKQILSGLLDFEVPSEEPEDVKEILDLTQSGQVRVTLRKQSLKKPKETPSKEPEGVKEIQSLTQPGKVSKEIALGKSRHIQGNLRKQDSSNLKEIQLEESEDIEETDFVSKIQNLTPSGKTTEEISLGKSRQIRGNLRKQDSSDLKEIPFEEPKDNQETAFASKTPNLIQSGKTTEEIFLEKSRKSRGNIRRERSSTNLKETLSEELEHVKEIQNLTPPEKMIEETSLGKSRQIRGNIRKERSSINREELEDVKEIQSLTQPGKVSEKIALGESRQIRDNPRRQISTNLREIALEKLEEIQEIQNLTPSGKIMEEVPLEKFRQVQGNLTKDQSFINLKVIPSEEPEAIQETENAIQSGKIGESSLRKSRQIRANPRRQNSTNLKEISLEEPEDIQEIQNLTSSRKINENIPLEKVQGNIIKERSLTNHKETLDFPKEEISLGRSKQIRGNLRKQCLSNLKEFPLEELENIQEKQNLSPSEKIMEQIPLAEQETENPIQSGKIIGENLGKSKQIRGNLKKHSSNPREILLEQPQEIQEIQKLTPSGKIIEEISLGKSRQIRDNIRKERRISFEEFETVEILRLNEEITLGKSRQIRDNLRKQNSTNSKETLSEEHKDTQEIQNLSQPPKIIEEISLGKSKQIRGTIRKERSLTNLRETSLEESEDVKEILNLTQPGKISGEISLVKSKQIRDNLRKQNSTNSKEIPSEEHEDNQEIQNLTPPGKIIEEISLGKSNQIRGNIRKERSLTNLRETSLKESEDVKEILNLTQPGKITGEISLVKSKQIRGNLRKQSSTNSKETPSEEHEYIQDIQNLSQPPKIIEEISLGKSDQIRGTRREERSLTNLKQASFEEYETVEILKLNEEIALGKSIQIRGNLRKQSSTNTKETPSEEREDTQEIQNLSQPSKTIEEISFEKSKEIRGTIRKERSLTNLRETSLEESENVKEILNLTQLGKVNEQISLGKSRQMRGNLRKQSSTDSKQTPSEEHEYIQEIQNLSQPSKTIEEISFGKSKEIRDTIRKERSLTNFRETSLEESEDVKEILNLTQPGKITTQISLEKSKQIRGNPKKQNSTNSKETPSEEYEDTQEIQNQTPPGKIIEEISLGKSKQIRGTLRKERSLTNLRETSLEESEDVKEILNLTQPGKITGEISLEKSKQPRGKLRKQNSTNSKETRSEEHEDTQEMQNLTPSGKINEEISLGKCGKIRGNLRKEKKSNSSKVILTEESEAVQETENLIKPGKIIDEKFLGKSKQIRGSIRKERSLTNLKITSFEESEAVEISKLNEEIPLRKSRKIRGNLRKQNSKETPSQEHEDIQNSTPSGKVIEEISLGKPRQVRGCIRKERSSTNLKEISSEEFENVKEVSLPKSKQIQDNTRREEAPLEEPEIQNLNQPRKSISGKCKQIRGGIRKERISTSLKEIPPQILEDIKEMLNLTQAGKVNEPLGKSRQIRDNIRKEQSSVSPKLSPSEETSEMENPTISGNSRQIRGNLRRQSSTNPREFLSEEPEDIKAIQNVTPPEKIIGASFLGKSRQIRGNLRRQSSTSIREFPSEEPEDKKKVQNATPARKIIGENSLGNSRQIRGNLRRQSSTSVREISSEEHEVIKETKDQRFRQFRGNIKREGSSTNLKGIPMKDTKDVFLRKTSQVRGNIRKEQSSINLEEFPSEGLENITGIEKPKIVGETSLGKSRQIRGNTRRELSLINLKRIPLDEAEDKQEVCSGKFRQIRGNISKDQSSTDIIGEITSGQIREERLERPSEDLDINENLITGNESDVEDENPPELTAEDGRAEPASLDTMPDLEPMVPRIKKRRKEDVEESKQYLDPSKRLYANDHLQEKKRRLSLEEYNIRKRRYLPSKTQPKENLFSGELVNGLDFESAKLQEEIEEEVLRNLTSPSRDEPESAVRTVEEPKESPRVLPRQIRFHDFSSFDDSDFEEETKGSVSCDLRVTFVDKSIVEEKLDSLVDFLPRVTSSRRNTSEEISQKIDDLFAERPIYEQRNYDRVLLDRFLRNESLSSDELTKLRDVVLGRKVTLHGVRRREDLKTVNIDFNDFNLRVVEDEPKPQTSKTKAELKMFEEDPEEEEEWFRNPEKPSEIVTPIEVPPSLPPKEDDNQQTALIKKPSEPTKLAKMNAIIQLYKKALETPNIGDKIKEIEEIIDKVTQGNLDQIKKAITSSTSKPSPSQPPTPNVYKITANDHPNDMKLHLKKVQGKRAKRKRFRNLYAEDSEEDEPTGEKHQRYDGYSIVSGDPKRLPKLVIKLKKAGPHPYVKLSRLPLLENMVRRRKRTVLLTGLAAQN